MNVSTSINVCFDNQYRVPVEEQMQRVYDAGFRTLDMNFWDWCNGDQSPFRADDWEKWVGRIAEKAASLGVRFTQSHADVYNFFQPRSEEETAFRHEMYRRSLIGSAMLGIPFSTFHPNLDENCAELPLEETIARNVAFFAPYVELGEKLGVGLALENMRRGVLLSAQALCELVDAFDSRSVGICWDTGHAHLCGQNQGESIRLMGKRLKNTHIADNMGVNDDHTAPFYGAIDWADVSRALHESGFEGDFTFEAHMLIRKVPMPCQADALRLLHSIGEAVVRLGTND